MHKFSHERADRLESPERYDILRPRETLQRFGLRPGMTIVDVGTGTGFFARAAGEIVGNRGVVFAVDSSEPMLTLMKEKGLPYNVRPLLSSDYTIPLPAGTADLVLAAFVAHENEERPRFLAELQRLLKPKGRILILEWKKQPEEQGPPEEERLAEVELDKDLAAFAVTEKGYLGPSYYFRLVEQA